MTLQPKVSICIPVLNTRPFLEERRSTIEAQTCQDFEVIVVDDGSTDGSLEFFKEWESVDPRVAVHPGPGKGLYPGWNDAINRAKGKYIYIATSDDLMAPNFLEEMISALEANPDCGMAHCPLRAFSDMAPDGDQQWWATKSPFALSVYGDVYRYHKRMAPGDGFLHGCGTSVYVSTTQLLTRREVFDEVGFFTDQWGSIGDFDWAIRASFVTSIVHVSTTWGGWRVHDQQATAVANMSKCDQTQKNLKVFAKCLETYINTSDSRKLLYTKLIGEIEAGWNYLHLKEDLKKYVSTKRWGSVLRICSVNPSLILGAIASRCGIKSNWSLDNERLIIDIVLKNLNWIDPL